MSASTMQNQTTGAAAPTTATKEEVVYNFPLSEIPKNPLGEGNYIKTAGCLIIGCVLHAQLLLIIIDVFDR